ncbi:hypothetical protein SRHO_G00154830 [Serrasalmus rhombeus]
MTDGLKPPVHLKLAGNVDSNWRAFQRQFQLFLEAVGLDTKSDARKWQDFAETYDFKHVTSSPLYPQSIGKAEKGVYILKQLLKKASDSNPDPYLALLSYRASPLECGLFPAEPLMKRKLRTTLPSSPKQKKHLQNI